MKIKISMLAIATVSFGNAAFSTTALAQNHDHREMNVSSQAQQTQDYACPMHPHIHGKNGDNCPICGMALVPAKTNDAPPAESKLSEDDVQGSHRVDPSLVQTIGIKTAPVQLEVLGDDIRAYGRVVPSTRVEKKITLRVEGWIEELAASALGDPVKKGQRLFNVNSPQLISAQADYITARKLGNEDIAKAAASRLKQLGVEERAMALIRQQKAPLTSVPFYAPISGVVGALNTRAGDYIKPGKTLLTLQDLRTVWVEADVPERDVVRLKEGDRVMIHLPEVGKKRPAQVTYIQPTVDPKTRTGKVRIELTNPDGALKPDTFVDVRFTSEKRHRLAVPTQAVLQSSMGDYVLRWLGEGRFKPVMVSTGAQSGGFIEIRKGLTQGQEIVTSGQFLLDAEANLKSGMGSMAGHKHGGGNMKDMPEQEMNMSDEQQSSQGGASHAGH